MPRRGPEAEPDEDHLSLFFATLDVHCWNMAGFRDFRSCWINMNLTVQTFYIGMVTYLYWTFTQGTSMRWPDDFWTASGLCWWAMRLFFLVLSVPFKQRDTAELCVAYLAAIPLLYIHSVSWGYVAWHAWIEELAVAQKYYGTHFQECPAHNRVESELAAYKSYDPQWLEAYPLTVACIVCFLLVACTMFWIRNVGGYTSVKTFLLMVSIRTLSILGLLLPFVYQVHFLNSGKNSLGPACHSDGALKRLHLTAEGDRGCRVPSCIEIHQGREVILTLMVPVQLGNPRLNSEGWRTEVLRDPRVARLNGISEIGKRLHLTTKWEHKVNDTTTYSPQYFLPARALAAFALVDAVSHTVPYSLVDVTSYCLSRIVVFFRRCLEAVLKPFTSSWEGILMGVGIAAGTQIPGATPILNVLANASVTLFVEVVKMVVSAVAPIALQCCRTLYANKSGRKVVHCIVVLAIGFVLYWCATEYLLKLRVKMGVYNEDYRVLSGLVRLSIVSVSGAVAAALAESAFVTVPAVPVLLVFGHELFVGFCAGARYTEPLLMLLICSSTLAVHMCLCQNRDQSVEAPWNGMCEGERVKARACEIQTARYYLRPRPPRGAQRD